MDDQYRRRPSRLYRSEEDSVLCGVCGGIADYFDFPPWGVRALFIILALMSYGWIVVLYIVLCFVLKKEGHATLRRAESMGFGGDDEFSASEMLQKVHSSFQTLDKRLQKMEATVTDPNFELEDEWEKL